MKPHRKYGVEEENTMIKEKENKETKKKQRKTKGKQENNRKIRGKIIKESHTGKKERK